MPGSIATLAGRDKIAAGCRHPADMRRGSGKSVPGTFPHPVAPARRPSVQRGGPRQMRGARWSRGHRPGPRRRSGASLHSWALATRLGLLALVLPPFGLLTALQYTPCVTGHGRTPAQPGPFSHAHHVGGLEGRYCHTGVKTSRYAGRRHLMPA
jgi:hypothetical protein